MVHDFGEDKSRLSLFKINYLKKISNHLKIIAQIYGQGLRVAAQMLWGIVFCIKQ
jgi:hypothetical protein